MKKSAWLYGGGFLLLMGALPFVGSWARQGNRYCSFNGNPIEPLYGVRIVIGNTTSWFCCMECAKNWLEKSPINGGNSNVQADADNPVVAIYVVDEISGKEIDAAGAYFVRSLIVTNKVTGNRVHSFKNKTDAEAHSRSLGGSLLAPESGPFYRHISPRHTGDVPTRK